VQTELLFSSTDMESGIKANDKYMTVVTEAKTLQMMLTIEVKGIKHTQGIRTQPVLQIVKYTLQKKSSVNL